MDNMCIVIVIGTVSQQKEYQTEVSNTGLTSIIVNS